MEVLASMWFNTQFTLGRAPHILRLKSHRGIIRPSNPVHLETETYVVKTANSAEEIGQVLSLRFEVFFREFSTKKVTFSLFPYDVDMHDFLCDHLIVKEKTSGKVVACYRLLADSSEKMTKHFYSEGEFMLDDFLSLPGAKLELGRACVHKNFRNGTVISLLWRGLLHYARRSGVRYMFGCSSINRKDFGNLPEVLQWLKQNDSIINDFEIDVREDYRIKEDLGLNLVFPEGQRVSTKALGSLMHMYVMAGAKMSGTFAYDGEMDCIDMFTVMDLRRMPDSFERRFS